MAETQKRTSYLTRRLWNQEPLGSYLRVHEENSINGQRVEASFGAKGQAKDGMFKVVIGHEAKMDCGSEVGKKIGRERLGRICGQ